MRQALIIFFFLFLSPTYGILLECDSQQGLSVSIASHVTYWCSEVIDGEVDHDEQYILEFGGLGLEFSVSFLDYRDEGRNGKFYAYCPFQQDPTGNYLSIRGAIGARKMGYCEGGVCIGLKGTCIIGGNINSIKSYKYPSYSKGGSGVGTSFGILEIFRPIEY